jgi:hypothetical protein
MRLRAFGAEIAVLPRPIGGIARRRVIRIAAQHRHPPAKEGAVHCSKGNPDGQAECTTRHYSRVDDTGARETTIRPAGAGFCKSRGAATQSATQAPSTARHRHGMAAATHRTTLIFAWQTPGVSSLRQKTDFASRFNLIRPFNPFCEINRLRRRANHWFLFARPALDKRGATRSSRVLARDAMDVLAARDERGRRVREIVWSRSPDAGIKFTGDDPANDGGKQARHTEESTI